jgi:hypothetical protein
MSSEIKADKWSPASGTSATIGDSGDTYTVPSGVTLDIASGATADFTGATVTGLTDNNTWVLLQTTTLSSTTGNVDFNNVFDSTYKNYVVFGSQIRGDSDSKILARFGTGSTPTYDSSSNYQRVVSYITANGGSDSIKHSTSDTAVLVTPNTIDTSDGDASFIMYFPEPQNTNRQFMVHFSGVEYDTNPSLTYFDGGGKCDNIAAGTPVTSVRFTPNSGSGFDSGTFKLYGVK